MVVRYAGPKRLVSYTCTRGSADYAEPLCQGLSNGTALDQWVARELLAVVEPAALEASLAAVAGVERQRAELARQWQLRRERAAYEVDRACRPIRELAALSVRLHSSLVKAGLTTELRR